ncbi:MAG: hypothetical protein ACK4S4_10070 [Pyrinomonadaceae bacterium]
MRISFSILRSTVVATALVLSLGAGFDALAQKGGKGGHGGKGHGRGDGGGPVFQQQGGPPPGRGWRKQESAPQQQAQQYPGWAQQQQRREERRVYRQVPVYQPPVVVRQTEYRDLNKEWKEERKQARRAEKEARREWKDAGREWKDDRREWRRLPQVVYSEPRRQQGPPPWAGVWTAPGQLKKGGFKRGYERRRDNDDYDRYYRRDYEDDDSYERRSWSAPSQIYNDWYVPNTYDRQGVIYVEPRAQAYYSTAPEVYYSSAPIGGYYPAQNYGYFPAIVQPAAYYDEPYYYGSDAGAFGDPFLGGIDWKGMLLGTVLNVVLGGGGDDDGGIFGNILGSGIGSIVGGGYGGDGLFGSGPYYGSNALFGRPAAYGYNDDYLVQQAYREGYERGYQNAGLSAAPRYDAVGSEPYLLDRLGVGYRVNGLDFDQRSSVYDAYARGYQDAVATAGNGYADDGLYGSGDLWGTLLTGLLSFVNG